MSTLTALQAFDNDVLGSEQDAGGSFAVTFTFNGKTYTGQRTPIPASLAMEDAGYVAQYDFHLLVRNGVWGAVPAPVVNNVLTITGNRIEVENRAYRIEKIESSQDGIEMTYSMKAKN